MQSYRLIRAFVLFTLLAAAIGPAQEQATVPESVLWKPTLFASDPVKITRVLYNGQPIESTVPFQGNTEWVKGIAVEIENVSHKTLSYIDIQVVFRTERPVVEYVSLGQWPEHRRLAMDGSGRIDTDPNAPISVAPGQRIVVPFAPAFPRIQAHVAKGMPKHELSDIHYCDIVPGRAYFSDGTMWQIGQFFKETHENKNTYDRSTPEEFYGEYGGPSQE
jgi:hypothetical protein